MKVFYNVRLICICCLAKRTNVTHPTYSIFRYSKPFADKGGWAQMLSFQSMHLEVATKLGARSPSSIGTQISTRAPGLMLFWTMWTASHKAAARYHYMYIYIYIHIHTVGASARFISVDAVAAPV